MSKIEWRSYLTPIAIVLYAAYSWFLENNFWKVFLVGFMLILVIFSKWKEDNKIRK